MTLTVIEALSISDCDAISTAVFPEFSLRFRCAGPSHGTGDGEGVVIKEAVAERALSITSFPNHDDAERV